MEQTIYNLYGEFYPFQQGVDIKMLI